MFTRIKTVLLLLLLSTLIIGVVVQNLQLTKFQLYPGIETNMITGVLVLIAFALGGLFCFFFLIAFGVRAYFREKSLQGIAKKKQIFIDTYVESRALTFVGPNSKAKEAWRKLIPTDPSKFLCRLELAKLLTAEGELREALSELDIIRSDGVNHPEVLFFASELNRKLGNSTAALDNLALLLSEYNNQNISQLARDLSSDLGRYDDALEYHERMYELDYLGNSKDSEKAALLVLKAQKDFAENTDSLTKALQKISKSYPESTEPLIALAKVQLDIGNYDDASLSLQELGKRTKKAAPWLKSMNIYLSRDMREKAGSIGRVALRNLEPKERFEVEILLVALEFDDGKIHAARKSASELQSFVLKEQNSLRTGQLLRFVLLYAQILSVTESDLSKSVRDWIVLASQGLHAPHLDMKQLSSSSSLLSAKSGEEELRPEISPIFSTP